jgi:hypothetical protein
LLLDEFLTAIERTEKPDYSLQYGPPALGHYSIVFWLIWHGLVPKESSLCSVGKRNYVKYNWTRILRVRLGKVQFKVFIGVILVG